MRFTFADPIFFLFLLLAPLVFLHQIRVRRGFTIVYSSVRRLRMAGLADPRRRAAVLGGLRSAALVLLVTALARPQVGRGVVDAEASGIDIVLALDSSGSMKAQDFHLDGRRVNRLEAVKSVVKDFIRKRRNDRIGLVVFAQEAYTQSPLTLNYDILLNLVDAIGFGIAGDMTALGNALALSVKDLQASTAASKVVVLLSDGVSNAGHVPPATAAEIAMAEKVRVYAIGVYTGEKVGIPFVDDLGIPRIFYQLAELDETGLQTMAQRTGGMFFKAANTEDLDGIYAEIDKLERSRLPEVFYSDSTDIFPWFVLGAMGLVGAEVVLVGTRLRKVP